MRVVFVSGKYINTKDDNKREGVANVGWDKGYGLFMLWLKLAMNWVLQLW
jgi:hypothetical protein